MQIIILGMHRSGTSALTRLVNMMGAYFGPDGVSTGANEENPKGFWERRDIRNLNDDLLASLGCDWHRASTFDRERIPSDALAEFDERARVIVQGLDEHQNWVVKEPRFCLTLPLWRRHLERPVAVIPYRGPLQVARSLEVRNGFPRAVGIALWERYIRSALTASEDLPRLLVPFDRLLAEPVEQLGALHAGLVECGATGLQMPAAEEIFQFVEPSLSHHEPDIEAEGRYLTPSQAALARALREGSLPSLEELPEESPTTAEILALFEHDWNLALERDATRKELDLLEGRLESLLQRHEALRAEARAERQEARSERAANEAELGWHLCTRELEDAEREAQLTEEWADCLARDASWLLDSNTWRMGDRLVGALLRVSGRSREAVEPVRLRALAGRAGKQLQELRRRRELSRGLAQRALEDVAKLAASDRVRHIEARRAALSKATAGIESMRQQVDGTIEEMLRCFEGLFGSRRWFVGSRLSRLVKFLRRTPPPRDGWAPESVQRIAGARAAWSSTQLAAPGADPSPGSGGGGGPVVMAELGKPVTVCVTIYNAFEEVEECLAALVRHTPAPHRILLLDDASPDPRMASMLESFAREHDRVEVSCAEENLGYTRNANRGLEATSGDVVLLNSDTQVTGGWLRKLRLAAVSQPRVATVTALSNAAGAFSVPARGEVNELPEGTTPDELAHLVEACSEGRRPETPTGNGFCMYITRGAIDAVGLFDAEAFPRGYGEENDFCMRAGAKGLVHLVEDSTFVYHARSASFGSEKAELIEASRQKLRELHPDYKRLVTEWLDDDGLDGLRGRLQEQLDALPSVEGPVPAPEPRILYLLHDGQGGTRYTSEDLIREVASGARCHLLRAGIDAWTLLESNGSSLRPVRKFEFRSSWRIQDPLDAERLAALLGVCAELRPDLIHVRHLIGTAPEILPLFEGLGIPTVLSFHDFYALCPTIQLVDDGGTYCAGNCTEGLGKCPTSRNWFREMPALKNAYVLSWQERMRRCLPSCRAWITTSAAARSVIVSKYPELDTDRFQLIEHGRDLAEYTIPAPPNRPGNRVAVIGALGPPKGLRLIEQLLELNEAAGRPFEFHFLGSKHREFRPEDRGGVVHGPYDRAELPAKLRGLGASFSLIASIWPETYCHTLTESWATGLPVFASDIGTLRDRIREHGGGWLLDPHDPEAWFEGMLRALREPAEYRARFDELARIEFPSPSEMAAHYLDSYSSLGVGLTADTEPEA